MNSDHRFDLNIKFVPLCLALSMFIAPQIAQAQKLRVWKSGKATDFRLITQVDSITLGDELAGSFADPRDRKIYTTTIIDRQKWMAQNLNYVPASGTSLCYNNAPDSCLRYGHLYTWATVMALPETCNQKDCKSQIQTPHQGICPTGWHVPTSDEWDIMIKYIAAKTGLTHREPSGWTQIGTALKSAYTWGSYSAPATDLFGLSLIAGGRYSNEPDFREINTNGFHWTSTQTDSTRSINRMAEPGNFFYRLDHSKIVAASLRCVNDTLLGAAPVDTTTPGSMISVKAGCFAMGEISLTDARPVHEVCVSAFQLDKYEVTQGEYQQVMGLNPSNYPNCGLRCPIEGISWINAKAYCTAVGKRLPTEAEWEYAARAGKSGFNYWGGADTSRSGADSYAWFQYNSGYKTNQVGLKTPNAWGFHDMIGNVVEYVSDNYGPFSSTPAQDPQGPSIGTQKTVKGGHWASYIGSAPLGNRYGMDSTATNVVTGFRCAK